MSPIRASQRVRYPSDWAAISQRIRTERARGRCECNGRCGSKHCRAARDRQLAQDMVLMIAPTQLLLAAEAYSVLRETPKKESPRCDAVNGQSHPSTGSRVVLTVAHLDHQPEHCDDDNLLAMCQACHLSYDREHHAETRAATRGALA